MQKKNWVESDVKNEYRISDPSQKVPSLNFRRAIWTSLNRIRTEQGNFNYLVHKWKMKDSPQYDYRHIQTIIQIVEECP